MNPDELLDIARQLVEKGKSYGVTLRLLGSLAVLVDVRLQHVA